METTLRRRKYWGWGYEDQQPSLEELRGAGAGIRAHLGFEPADVEEAVPLDAIELTPPRLQPPEALAPLCSSETYERASHAYGRSYRDIVRAFRGRFDHPPDAVAHPADEDDLRGEGLTLRHFPQSFEYSTLGGWIATRAGGHFATLYTHIDDLVESVRALTPSGEWESRRLPGSGAGPSPDRLLIGSEGILGVFTEAWVRLHERPTYRSSAAVTFPDF